LEILNEHLQSRTFLVGERVTLADIVVVCAFYKLYTMVLDTGFRKQFVNANRWFVTCVNQPFFKSVLGEVKLCEKMMVAKAPEVSAEAQHEEVPKPKPQAAPAKQQPKKEEEEEEESFEEKPKGKNPLDALPKPKMDLDEWKRTYSNAKDIKAEAMPWFWQQIDAQNEGDYCLYFSHYKFNDENTKLFMTNNLVGGFVQRLDKLRKYGFGNVLIFGEEPRLEISGVWLFRGNEIPAEMKESDDFPSYDWVRVDLKDTAQRKLIEDYWAWSGSFEGKPGARDFHDHGKVFK